MVPALSIIGMSFTLLICLLLTFGLYLFLRKRLRLKIAPALVGAAAFIVFALVLEQLLHAAVLQRAPDGTIAMMERPALYVLYGALAAGVFEETARLLSFKLLRRKYPGFSTAVSYGIGHGGIEVLILVALTMVNNLIFSVMINSGSAEALGNTPQITAAVSALTNTAPGLFFVSGIERILAMTVQISLSVIMWHAVNGKSRMWLYPCAIALHALVDVPAALMQCGVIKSVALTEVLVAICAVGVAGVAAYVHRQSTKPVL